MTMHPCFEILQCSNICDCTAHIFLALHVFGNIVHRAMQIHKTECNTGAAERVLKWGTEHEHVNSRKLGGSGGMPSENL